MNKIANKYSCTGCGACSDVCSVGAIKMTQDSFGFVCPVILQDKCVDCGLCAKICPVNKSVKLNCPIKAYALHAKECGVRNSSSSGGATYLIAESIIRRGGVIYACVQTDYRNIFHKRITVASDLLLIKGSKYVQSDIRDTFKECRRDLIEGKEALYIGTPCQIAGLKAYLHKEYSNLYTVDLVCHGVPSQLFLQDDIKSLGIAVPLGAEVRFRKKVNNKVKFGLYIYYNGAEIYSKDYPNDYFIAGFLKGLFFRPNCYDCQYACPERTGDITVGDFWGLGSVAPTQMNVNDGVSLTLVNTDKGNLLMDGIREVAIIESRPMSEAIDNNAQLRQSFAKPVEYDSFREDYLCDGYKIACKKSLKDYIHDNRLTMLCENHPLLMLPYRIYQKIKEVCL